MKNSRTHSPRTTGGRESSELENGTVGLYEEVLRLIWQIAHLKDECILCTDMLKSAFLLRVI